MLIIVNEISKDGSKMVQNKLIRKKTWYCSSIIVGILPMNKETMRNSFFPPQIKRFAIFFAVFICGRIFDYTFITAQHVHIT